MNYRPRVDCSDVPHDSDDRWLTRRDLDRRVEELLEAQRHVTPGIAEVHLDLGWAEVSRRLVRWEPRLRHLGRQHDVDGVTVYHWAVAELIAHEALYEWWSMPLRWPLGWWPENFSAPPPSVPESVKSPEPFSTEPAAR